MVRELINTELLKEREQGIFTTHYKKTTYWQNLLECNREQIFMELNSPYSTLYLYFELTGPAILHWQRLIFSDILANAYRFKYIVN